MGFRAPKFFLEWLLIFSPTMVMVASGVVWSLLYRPRSEHDEAQSSLLWLAWPLIALFLCVLSGFVFTKPDLRPADRIIWALNGVFIITATHVIIVLVTFAAFPSLK